MPGHSIPIMPLTREGFAPYGEVIDETGGCSFGTNGGEAIRVHGLASVDCSAEGGRPLISLFTVRGPTFRKTLRLMERHPISTQAFVPTTFVRTIVVVAPADENPSPTNIRAFVTDGRQGFSYARGTWHHPLITLTGGTFLVVDRTGPGTGFSQDYEDVEVETMALELAVDSSSSNVAGG
jgi:ureidoglycolate lyase